MTVGKHRSKVRKFKERNQDRMTENYDIPAPKKRKLSLQIDPAKFEKATDEEKKQADVMAESTTFFKDGMRKLLRNPLAIIAIVILCIVIATIIIAPHVVPYGYDEIITVNGVRDKRAANLSPFQFSDMEKQYMEESGEKLFPHIMGTDELCRDYFIRVVYGTRVSLLVGIFASLMVLIIGTVYGSISGYAGGRVDLIMMRIVDIIYAVPTLLYVILIMLVFGSNVWSVLLAICVSSWVGLARQVRAQVMSLKEQEYAQCARVMGASDARILFRHLITNSIGPIIVNTTLMVPSAIFTEAFLSFVGIGISIPQASWGTMANDARSLISSYPLQMVWPVAAICLTMLALNFIGDALNDALDPKKRGQ